MDRKRFIVSADFGTSSVRCFVYDLSGNVVARVHEKLTLLYPHQGWCEINPEELWNTFHSVFTRALKDANATAHEIEAFGLATHRGTFVTWDKLTGEPFHNLITWKDLRADALVNSWNESAALEFYRQGAGVKHAFTHKRRYLAMHNFQFINSMVCPRLRWMIDNNRHLKAAVDERRAAVGTLDTYLLHRMTLGHLHATDYSNVCVMGIYDPFKLKWVDKMMKMEMINIPREILPEVRNSAGDWGKIHASIFGAEIPIRCVISDQGASTFGSFCFDEGDVRLSMGTGSSLVRNTGSRAKPVSSGLYPTIGWKIETEVVYMAEAYSNDAATIIDWCRDISLFADYDDISHLISTTSGGGNLFFVPAFGGIQAPVEDASAATGFIGMGPSVRKEEMLRAAVESLAFRVFQMCHVMATEIGTFQSIRVDGGVCKNDFLMQLIADLTNVKVERPACVETAAHGAAYLAGLTSGAWQSRAQLLPLYKIDRVFKPDPERWLEYQPLYTSWKKAVGRLSKWY